MAPNYETAVRQMYAALLIARDTLDHMTSAQFARGEDKSARNAIANAIGDYEQKRPEVRDAYKKDDPHTTLAQPAFDVAYTLARLTEKVERANAIQHSGTKVRAEDWSELYMLTNEARAVLQDTKGDRRA